MLKQLIRLSEQATERGEARRWWILGVLCFSLLVLVLDNSILNVAIPTIVDELDASTSQLQWMIDGYTLVLAGLLLTAGSMGDRYGRRHALQIGFVVFGLGSLLSALAGSASQLIVTRGVMGIGGALIMPATLSIITNVFPGHERPKAIGIWAATAGVAVVLGPLTGGFLLEHFYWGSIFLVNLPIVAVGLVAGVFMIPNSRDPHPPRLDPAGAILSIVGLSSLIYAVIEGPERGWTAPETLVGFALGAVVLGLFFWWEQRIDHPMLDLTFFKNPRFSAGSGAIALTFFAMFGSMFLLTQYLQFVLGYSPLATGVRLLPFAIPMMIVSPLSARLAARIGAKLTVASGLGLLAAGLLTLTGVDAGSSYATISWRFVLVAAGIALTMAPATEAIMGSLPLAKAGVGSAVNDTTRMVGGTVGVAVIGSVFSSIYASELADSAAAQQVPPGVVAGAKDSIGFALTAADRIGGPVGRAFGEAATAGFVDGFHAGLGVGAAVAVVGMIGVLLWLPAHGRTRTGAGAAGDGAAGQASADGAQEAEAPAPAAS
jgi:EmrB/QacA subfamily drug resistance transporter